MIVLVGILVVMLSNPLLLLKASLTSGERPDTFDYPDLLSILHFLACHQDPFLPIFSIKGDSVYS